MAASIPLNVTITATDEASPVVNSMSSSLENAKGSLLALGAAASIAFAGFVAAANTAVTAAEAHQNTEAQLNAVLTSTKDISGATADGINQLAASLQSTTGYSKETITQIDTLLLGFKDISASVLPAATQAILDFSARMGVDATQAAVMLGKALADPAIAVGTLTREHVVLSQAQQEAIKNFDAVGDTAGAQGVIIAALNQTFGGAAEQTQTYAFQQRLLQSQLEDMNVTVGTALLPVLTQLLAVVEPVITAIADWTAKHPLLTQVLVIFVGVLLGLTVALTALAGAVLLVETVMSPVTLTILAIAAAIAILIALAVVIVDNWTPISAFFESLWADIEKVFQTSINAIIAFFQPLLNVIQTISNAIGSVGSGIASVASSVGKSVSGAVSTVIPHALGGGVISGQSYLVGENGPEIFSSSVPGTITPNNQISGGGGSGVTVVVNGGNYLDSNAAQMFGDMLAKTIGRQLKLRTI